jgi:gliding motility-associated-like protein
VWENRDLGSWTVLTSTITKGVLSEVKAVPKVFTPNGDGINDFTVIEFSLSKITAKMKIKIFDTRGGLVTTIFDDNLEPAPWFVKDKLGNTTAARNMPGYWDGTDEDGDLVPPGVYLYQVVAETDDGDKVESGTVVVGY